MAISDVPIARRYENIQAGVPIVSIPIPLFAEDEVRVFYGRAVLEAVRNVDYTIEFALGFDTFTLTPTASLVAKIDALIASDPTNEENAIVVRRELAFESSVTPPLARNTAFMSREIERSVMRDQQLDDALRRTLRLPETFSGAYPRLTITPGANGQVPVWRSGQLVPETLATGTTPGNGSGGDAIQRFTSAAAVRAGIAGGTLEDNEVFELHGARFQVDRDLDDDPASWFFNTNGDTNPGVRDLQQYPSNYYAFMGFKTQSNNKLYLSTSPDGRRFFRVNKYPIQRGGSDSTIGGRDSQLYWNENLAEWWAPVTSGSDVTDWDMSVFRSRDLVQWGLSRGFLDANSAAGLVRGQDVPGGTIPVERQWSNKFARLNGTLYVITSLQVLPSGINPFGNSGPRLRPYFAEVLDEVDMEFGPVTPMQIGTNQEAKLNPDVIIVDGTYWCCIKDSPTRTVEVWSSASLAGPWTRQQVIDLNSDPNNFDSLEGNTWGVHRYTDPNDDQVTLVKYRIMLSNNRDAEDNLVGRQLFVESTTGPGGPYGAIQELEFSQATRNGVVTNVGMIDDPRAMESLLRAEAAYGGEFRVDIDEASELRNPTHNLWPQERFEYYISGAGGSTTVTVQGKLADTFYLAVHNTNPQARITVTGNDFSRPIVIGGGYQEMVEMRWSREIDKYIPVGRYPVPGVSRSTALAAGASTIVPTLDTEYYILGAAGAATVTINERGADSFYVAVHNSAAGATITFPSTDACRPFTVGGGQQELIRVIWSEQIDKYIPVGRLASGGGGSGITVQDEGTALSTAATTLNFTGAGVEATGTGATKTINIPGGGSGVTVQEEGTSLATAATTLNFVGAQVTAAGTGATKTITVSPQFTNWAQVGNVPYPTQAGTDLGRSANPIAGVWFEGQSTDGTNDGSNDWRLIFAQNGSPRVQSTTTTGNNAGFDLSARTNWHAVSITSTATVTWSRDNGAGLILTGAAGQNTTVNFSTLVVGETMEITINNPNGRVFTFTGPRAIDWVNDTDPPNDANREVDIVFEYQNTSSLRGIWVQRRA